MVANTLISWGVSKIGELSVFGSLYYSFNWSKRADVCSGDCGNISRDPSCAFTRPIPDM